MKTSVKRYSLAKPMMMAVISAGRNFFRSNFS